MGRTKHRNTTSILTATNPTRPRRQLTVTPPMLLRTVRIMMRLGWIGRRRRGRIGRTVSAATRIAPTAVRRRSRRRCVTPTTAVWWGRRIVPTAATTTTAVRRIHHGGVRMMMCGWWRHVIIGWMIVVGHSRMSTRVVMLRWWYRGWLLRMYGCQRRYHDQYFLRHLRTNHECVE